MRSTVSLEKMAVDLRTSLRELSLQDHDIEETDKEIGNGSYGIVKEILYKGLRCAGKDIHRCIMLGNSTETQALANRFKQECIRLSKLRHPNIVLLLGVHFKQGVDFPILVMELMPTSLDSFLENCSNIPLYVKNNILLDVAQGLRYMHSLQDGPLVHRDLTSKNVLLSENLRAKIADLGLARIVTHSEMLKLTKVPGNPVHMPPEAFQNDPQYNEKLDMFSYGNLILNTVNQVWPTPTPIEDSNQSEVDRRIVHFEIMGDDHQLSSLAKDCLSNDPSKRPSAPDIIKILERIISKCARPPFSDSFEMFKHLLTLSNENDNLQKVVDELKQREKENQQEVREKAGLLEVQNDEASIMKSELETYQQYLEAEKMTNAAQQKLINDKDRKIQVLERKIDVLNSAHSPKHILFDPMTSLSWDLNCTNLPEPRKHPQAVEFKGEVYVGSGYSSSDESSHKIYRYNKEDNKWDALPESPTRWFALAVFDGMLILIGGKTKENQLTNIIQVLSDDEQKWLPDKLKPILTARMGACAASLGTNLVVAGGWDNSRDRLKVVEVYDKRRMQWSSCETCFLPKGIAEVKMALLDGDQWYLVGGANQGKSVYCASLAAIIKRATQANMRAIGVTHVQQEAETNVDNPQLDGQDEGAISHSEEPESQQLWHTLQNAPYEFSTCAILGGCLIMLGGITRFGYSNGVFAYVPHSRRTGSWLRIDDMPLSFCRACAVTLGNRELMVIGGRNKTGQQISTVYKCSLVQSCEQTSL